MISIALDVPGGDLSFQERIHGALHALNCDEELRVVFVGDESQIEPFVKSLPKTVSLRISIVHTLETISMAEAPSRILKEKKSCSLSLATKLVKEAQCAGIVSAGNTGAQMAAGLFLLGRMKGIDRPGIAIPVPTNNGYSILIDGGANTDVKPKNLLDFARMGSLFIETVYGIKQPKVAILNNGSEQEKGNLLTKESYSLLKREVETFTGFIEGRDLMSGIADVIVCDGFTGNIILKTMEGTAIAIFSHLKKEIKKSIWQKLGAILLQKSFQSLKDKLDYRLYGGAPLLGINGISIICHGTSDRVAIKNAILLAVKMVRQKTIEKMASLT